MINVRYCSGTRGEAYYYRHYDEPIYVKDRQRKYNVTLRPFRKTIVAMKKQEVLHILSVCL